MWSSKGHQYQLFVLATTIASIVGCNGVQRIKEIESNKKIHQLTLPNDGGGSSEAKQELNRKQKFRKASEFMRLEALNATSSQWEKYLISIENHEDLSEVLPAFYESETFKDSPESKQYNYETSSLDAYSDSPNYDDYNMGSSVYGAEKHISSAETSPVSNVKDVETMCANEGINSVHESFLAKNIVTDRELNRTFYQIYGKILTVMENDPSLRDSLAAWDRDPEEGHVLPVTQKHKLHNKIDTLKNDHDSVLALDYLLFHGKKLDNVGIRDLIPVRDGFYRSILMAERGTRRDVYEGTPRTHYGITKFDVSELEMPDAKPWQHWGRDTCKVDPTSSTYNQNVTRLGIPLACGISGSSTIALWVVLKSKVDLNVNEMRLLILSIWAGLAADGGHSLNETLSAMKLNAQFLAQKMQDGELSSKLSKKTVDSLIKVTKDISALGSESESGHFGRYYDSFFRKIAAPEFQKVRESTATDLKGYLRKYCK